MSFQPGKISAESVLNFRRGPQAAAVAPLTADSLLPVLIVLHQETSTPGRVGNALRALGHRLDIRRSAPRLQGSRFVRTGRIMSTIGTTRDLNFPRAPNCWRRAATSR